MKNNSGEPFLVKYVNFSTVKLVDESNQCFPKIKVGEAKEKALKAGLDLVCFSKPSKNDLAFCKIINFGKWKYENGKKRKKQQKGEKRVTKEIRFSVVIGDYDIEHKIKQVNEFLDEGNDVVLSMILKGRQRVHFPEAEIKMNEIISKCLDHGQVVNTRKTHNTIIVRLNKK